MAAPPEESPGTAAWTRAELAVGKRQKRVLQHHSNAALWTGQIQYVYQASPEEAPLASTLLVMLGVEPGSNLTNDALDAVVLWFRTNSVPDVPATAGAARVFVTRTVEKLSDMSDSEIEQLSTVADAEEKAETVRRQAAYQVELANIKKDAQAHTGDARSTAEEKKSERMKRQKENCLKQGVAIFEWPAHFRLSDDALHKMLEKKPDGYYEAPSCTVLVPSWADLKKLGIYASPPAGYDEEHTLLLAALRTLYVALCQPAPKMVTPSKHDENVVSLCAKDWNETTKVYEDKPWYPMLDYRAMVRLVELATPIAYLRDKQRRVAHCADFFNEVVRKLNANSKETGTAVLMDFEFERSQCVRALLDDLQRQSHGAPGTSGMSTYPGKRKASEYETQTKVAKRPHPEGVCKFWAGTGRCKYSADDCTAGTNPHPEDAKGKFPGAENWGRK